MRFTSLLFVGLLVLALFFPLTPLTLADLENKIYVVEKPGYFILHSMHLPDFYISKDGFQISNNLTDRWAEIQVGLNLSWCNNGVCSNVSKWTRGLDFSWRAVNYTVAANVTGKYVIWKRNLKHLTLYLNYHIDNATGYMRIRPYLNFSLPNSVTLENVVYTYRMENVSLGGPENDFVVYPKNNGTEKALPVYGVFNYNYTKHPGQYGFFDNVTGKFLEYVWNREFSYKNTTKRLNATIGRAMGRTFQVEYYYPGKVQGDGLFFQDWFWLDPTEEANKYYRSDSFNLCSYNYEKLRDTRSGSGQCIDRLRTDPEADMDKFQWGTDVYINYCNGTATRIGEKVATVERISAGEGMQSATWRPAQNYTLHDNCTLQTRLYVRPHHFKPGKPPFGYSYWGAWIEIDTNYRWQTEQLNASILLGCAGVQCPPPPTWNFYYYTKLILFQPDPKQWKLFFCFDTSTYNSRIFNITIETPSLGAWNLVETWTGLLVTRSWLNVESWTGTLVTRAWTFIEDWAGTLITRGWLNVETWTGTFTTLGWHFVEAWTGLIQRWRPNLLYPAAVVGFICLPVLFLFIVWYRRKT